MSCQQVKFMEVSVIYDFVPKTILDSVNFLDRIAMKSNFHIIPLLYHFLSLHLIFMTLGLSSDLYYIVIESNIAII